MNGIAEEWRKLADLSAIKEALRIAVKSPLTLWRFIIYGRQKAVQAQVKHLMGYVARMDTDRLPDYWQAMESKHDLYADMRKALVTSPHSNLQQAPEYLYVIVRALKPEAVVETGVAAGISSSFILQALEDNNKGTLYSIDLPNYDLPNDLTFIPDGKHPGFAIPERLKKRWQLRLGTSKDILPGLLAEIGRVDIFLHDSEHSYENMLFEFVAAWDYLQHGGLLLSHDIAWNNAFKHFSREIKHKPTELYLTGAGAIAK
jgi:hypothetical protein